MSLEFSWNEELGRGYLPVNQSVDVKEVYGLEYFDHYKELENTIMAKKLNDFRAAIVNKYTLDVALDIGIGSGTFLKTRKNSCGYDVNPYSIRLLQQAGLYYDPYEATMQGIKAVTFWDSLEHIDSPEVLLNRILEKTYVFVSLPIFRDKEHILKSKHFKPNEHIHYFTESGFERFMTSLGFNLIEKTDDESKIGREDILTFVFQR